MKKQIIMLFIAIALLQAAAAVRPDITVSGFSAKDGSIQVGKDFTLVLTLTNINQDACAQNVWTTVQANSPFIMRGLSTVYVGDLCAKPSGTIEIPMRVDPTASGGFYQITVTNSFETLTLAQFTSTATLNLLVDGTPNINANIISSSPVDVYPGDTATITVNIENEGTFQAQSVKATLGAQPPLETEWSQSYGAIGTLNAKQSKIANFQVTVPKDAQARDYNLTMNIEYQDENLRTATKAVNFLFHVKKRAQFETSDTSSDMLYANDNSKRIRITVKNTGTDVANKIQAKLLPQFPFSTDGSIRYVDSLAPGQSIPLEFTIDTDKEATTGTYGINMLLDYEDAQGKSLQDTAKVALTIKQKDIFRAVFLDYWFIWMIAAAVAFMIARRRMKKK